jgi:hypothetical protein
MDQPDARIIPIVSPGFEHRNLCADDLIRHFCHCLYTAGQAQALVSDQQALSGCHPPPGCPHSLKKSHEFAHAAKARFPPFLAVSTDRIERQLSGTAPEGLNDRNGGAKLPSEIRRSTSCVGRFILQVKRSRAVNAPRQANARATPVFGDELHARHFKSMTDRFQICDCSWG